MKTENELQAQIDALVAERNEKFDALTMKENAAYREQIKALRSELQDLLSDGAVGCAICGRKPLVIHQPHVAHQQVIYYYEVDCIEHTTPRAKRIKVFSDSPSAAVQAWNEVQQRAK